METFQSGRAVSAAHYKRQVAYYWREEIAELEPELQRAQLKRVDSFMRCGQKVAVRHCEGCGDPRCGSGTFIGIHTCKSKSCTTCAWVRARGVGEGLARAYELVETMPGYHWQNIVVSIPWDPGSEDDYSVKGLRARAMKARRLGTRIWNKVLKCPEAGMLRTVEVSARGFVHMNLIYYGPEAYGPDIEDVAGECKDLRVHVQPINTDPDGTVGRRKPVEDPRGSKKGLQKAAEYAAKGHERLKGSMAWDEGFMAGERTAEVVDAQLAARWELATFRLHLMERYGALRGMEIEEHPKDKSVDEDDKDTACESCGLVGQWKWGYRRTQFWMQDCHDRGRPGLAKSNWTARDGPDT